MTPPRDPLPRVPGPRLAVIGDDGERVEVESELQAAREADEARALETLQRWVDEHKAKRARVFPYRGDGAG